MIPASPCAPTRWDISWASRTNTTAGAVNTTVNGDGAKNGLDSTTLMGGNLADPNNQIKIRHYENFAAQMRKLYKNNVGKDEEWIVVERAGAK